MESIYLDTTIASFYFEDREDEKSRFWRAYTRRWWDGHRGTYRVVTSEIALVEAARSPEPKRTRMLQMLAPLEQIEISPAVESVAEFYVQQKVMPSGLLGDAGHVAAASYHGISYLLTWNIRHLARPSKVRHLEVLNARLRLATPLITTPEFLLAEGEQDG